MFLAPLTVHTGGVSEGGGDRGWRPRSQRKASAPVGWGEEEVCLLIEALLGLLQGATHADSRTGRWGECGVGRGGRAEEVLGRLLPPR